MAAVTKKEELENRCKEQEAKIQQLNQLVMRLFWTFND